MKSDIIVSLLGHGGKDDNDPPRLTSANYMCVCGEGEIQTSGISEAMTECRSCVGGTR